MTANLDPKALERQLPSPVENPAAAPATPEPEHPATARYHEHLLAAQRSQGELFGRHLGIFCGVALAGSMGYVKEVVGPAAHHRWIAGIAWVVISIALAASLLSMKNSPLAFQEAADGYPWKDVSCQLGGKYAVRVARYNGVAVWALIGGVLAFGAFILVNLG